MSFFCCRKRHLSARASFRKLCRRKRTSSAAFLKRRKLGFCSALAFSPGLFRKISAAYSSPVKSSAPACFPAPDVLPSRKQRGWRSLNRLPRKSARYQLWRCFCCPSLTSFSYLPLISPFLFTKYPDGLRPAAVTVENVSIVLYNIKSYD